MSLSLHPFLGQSFHLEKITRFRIEGFAQIKSQLCDFLSKEGIEPIKAAGEKFDPNTMEATEEAAIADTEAGVVTEEIQKGYTMHGKVIRPAKVKISK